MFADVELDHFPFHLFRRFEVFFSTTTGLIRVALKILTLSFRIWPRRNIWWRSCLKATMLQVTLQQFTQISIHKDCKQAFCLRQHQTESNDDLSLFLLWKTIPTHRGAQTTRQKLTMLMNPIDLKASFRYDCTIAFFSMKNNLQTFSVWASSSGMLFVCLARKTTCLTIGNEEKRCKTKQFSFFSLAKRADINFYFIFIVI